MDIIERFRRDNYLVIDKLYPVSLIDDISAEVHRQLANIDPDNLPPHLRIGPRRVQLPVRMKGPILAPQTYAHPLLLHILSSLLGGDFLLDSISCVVAFAHSPQQRLHRDNGDLFHDRPDLRVGLPPYAITVNLPLIDLHERTGATRLFPGSQELDQTEFAARLADELGDLRYLKRGGCYLMDYRVVHQGTPNHADVIRPMLSLIYVRPWFTDPENFKEHPRIFIGREEWNNIPEEHRRLFRRLAAPGAFNVPESHYVNGTRKGNGATS